MKRTQSMEEESDTGLCRDCGEKKTGDITFHALYCYDVYVVSPPCPQNGRQRYIDDYLAENIVKPLEQAGFNCYHGSRNMTGGDIILSAFFNPVTIIPTIIIPIYKDQEFACHRNFLFHPQLFKRFVLLLFDSSKLTPHNLIESCYSLKANDSNLLPKIINTIHRNCKNFSLHQRKALYEEKEIDIDSTVSSSSSEAFRQNHFLRSDNIRRSVMIRNMERTLGSYESSVSSESEFLRRNLIWRADHLRSLQQTQCDETTVASAESDFLRPMSLRCLKSMTSPDELLRYCDYSDEKVRLFAAKMLTKHIQKNFTTFSRKTHLQRFEKIIRSEIEKEYSENNEFEKLYFFIMGTIFIRIYKCNDSELKSHMKSLPAIRYKARPDVFAKLPQKNYQELTDTLLAKIKKTWSKRWVSNALRIKKLEFCLSFLDHKGGQDVNSDNVQKLETYLTDLSWDLRYIVLLTLAEKMCENNMMGFLVLLLDYISRFQTTKYKEILLDVIAAATDHIQEHYTTDNVSNFLSLVEGRWNLLHKFLKKRKDLLKKLKACFLKLVYHPLSDIRNSIALLLFVKKRSGFEVGTLGSACITVDKNLVQKCIRETLSNDHPDMSFKGEVQMSQNAFIFNVQTPDGEALVYALKQNTLNHVLQTNSTDDALQSFQEMRKAVALCQGSDCIAKLQNIHSNGTLPFFVLEHGQPLLHFLHQKLNRLTWAHVLDILIDVTKAVDYCHDKSVVLRDITPDSFVVIHKTHGGFQIKLSGFLYAKHLQQEDSASDVRNYVQDNNILTYQGDSNEAIAAYFSAPESFKNKTFSWDTEAWMLAATIYSILLYGKQPFQDLAHLNVVQFVSEIISGHTAKIPDSIPLDLWKIVSGSLSHNPSNRMSIKRLLRELTKYKSTLGRGKEAVHCVTPMCKCKDIYPQDILRGYADVNGKFIKEEIKELTEGSTITDASLLENSVYETVSVTMSLTLRRQLKALHCSSLLRVEKIMMDCNVTKLVSYPLDQGFHTLDRISVGTNWDTMMFFFEEITSALQYLHRQDLLHCDLRCSHIYVNEDLRIIKVSHLGRAASLRGRKDHPYVFKTMPHGADKWSAPEVRVSGMYSQESDVFSLAVVIWEAISTQSISIYSIYLLPPFAECSNKMESYAESMNLTDVSGDCIFELSKCLQKCLNPNPSKRPSLDYMLGAIQKLRQPNGNPTEECSGYDEVTYETDTDESKYETIVDFPSSEFCLLYAWRDVVYELESANKEKTIATVRDYEDIYGVYNIPVQRKIPKRKASKLL
ncbi:uncharacterized protein LOC128639754 [Bombina bombina]|uniref:uncharacterized protein LOC128639754 n=1 Tax=Bombina bombina TaxID=8345 RepID=UPI00235A5B89|nr:uncharacterized protein LOC128639754 [Bombina bombina]